MDIGNKLRHMMKQSWNQKQTEARRVQMWCGGELGSVSMPLPIINSRITPSRNHVAVFFFQTNAFKETLEAPDA
jgi:hypothetical protein